MKELKNVKIECYRNAILVRYVNHRIGIIPTLTGITITTRRLIDSEEQDAIKIDPEYLNAAAEAFIVKDSILQSHINFTYETAFIINNVLMDYQREIRTIQMLSIFGEDISDTYFKILNSCDVKEFVEISNVFDTEDYTLFNDMIQSKIQKSI